MALDRPGTTWGKKHYKIGDISQYHLDPAPFVADAVPFLIANDVRTVLDAGCGQGRNSLHLQKQGLKVTPVDASKEACKLTQQLFTTNGLDTTPINEELQNISASVKEQIDAIICVTVLTHILDPEVVLREFHRILKPNGLLIADFATTEDSTYPTISKTGTPLGTNVFLEEGTIVKYFEDPKDVEALFHRFKVLSTQEITFEEPPHPGSRQYTHSHTSFVVTAQK